MSLESHLAELERRHKTLETEIEKEMQSPSSDDLHIQELKRRKLGLKDEISQAKSKLGEMVA